MTSEPETSAADADAAGPLTGVRVLDLTSVVSGPNATMMLADQGADVIKIEPATGDIMRRAQTSGGFTPAFVNSNRSKRSIALNLKGAAGAALLRRLIATSDVFVQNFRPGVIDRLGFGEAAAREINPGIVYASISGVGESGPYVRKRVYDPVVQALSGLADIQRNIETQRPQLVRTLIADKTTALVAAQAITAALYNKAVRGEGQHVRLAMLDVVIAYLWPEGMSNYTVVGDEEQAEQIKVGSDMIFATVDGYITAGTVSDAEWRGLCSVLEKPEWVEDERFRTGAARQANLSERMTLVGEALSHDTSANWLAKLDAAQVPCAPVLTRRELLSDPQVAANGLIVEFEQPGLGLVRQARPAARFAKTPSRIRRPAPAIGEHTRDILAELGEDEATISETLNQLAEEVRS